jgi:hypothetical protein
VVGSKAYVAYFNNGSSAEGTSRDLQQHTALYGHGRQAAMPSHAPHRRALTGRFGLQTQAAGSAA